ncbi:unnamed protein product [Dovyalis caffra]|uniref:Uncharacterized protein n=1 Tax=Dovyalis caffra TaxID=77055 RepID=A0AAV1S5B6_9ROSI|nr:unnamed protein product [Dovyalis caffra]
MDLSNCTGGNLLEGEKLTDRNIANAEFELVEVKGLNKGSLQFKLEQTNLASPAKLSQTCPDKWKREKDGMLSIGCEKRTWKKEELTQHRHCTASRDGGNKRRLKQNQRCPSSLDWTLVEQRDNQRHLN